MVCTYVNILPRMLVSAAGAFGRPHPAGSHAVSGEAGKPGAEPLPTPHWQLCRCAVPQAANGQG